MDYKPIQAQLQHNLNLLREREAKYAGQAPPELLNQIDDHEQAIALTEQARAGQISQAEWKERLKPLLVDIRERTADVAKVHLGSILGNLSGYVAGGDIHIHSDPELRAKVTALEQKIADLEKVQELIPEPQLEAALAPLKAQLATLRAQQPPPDYATPDPTTLQQHYLDHLLAEVSQLSLLHIDPGAAERRMELAQVYTALLTTGSQEEPERARMAPAREKPERVSALAQLNRHDRLVILGDAGSGKSTLVNFVGLCMAGELLTGDGTYLNLLRTPLPPDEEDSSLLFDKEKEAKPQPWDHGPLLPIRIVLRKFAAEGLPPPGRPATAKHLWEYLSRQLEQADLEAYAPLLKGHFQQKGGLLLLDGLDEVPEPEARGPQLKQVIEAVARRYRHCRLVVTSRPYAYQNPAWHLDGFTPTTLAPFSRGQIEQFIERWYRYLGRLHRWSARGRQRRIEQLSQAIFSHPGRLRALAERPLLLTLMANLHASRGTLPEKRAELYEETVVLLLDRWERGRLAADQTVISPRLSEWLEIEQRQIRALLEQLAYAAHAHQPAPAEGPANLDGEKLLRGLLQLTQRTIHPAELLDYLDQRAGILEARGDNLYRFPHRTFQEYLAGCHLTGLDDFAAETAWLVRSDPNRWREVALLAGARAASRMASAIWLLVDELCPRPVTATDQASPDLLAALLAGQALVETADLAQPSPANRYKVERVRGWLKHILAAGGLPAIERANAGQILAALEDDRDGVGTQDGLPDLAWCHVEAGPFTMGSDEGDEDEKPPHEVTLPPYQIGRYPITNAQFGSFIDDGGYTEKWRHCWTEAGWQEKEKSNWQEPRFWHHSRYNQTNQPVVSVSWYEAVAFCRWLTERLRAAGQLEPDELLRLPTEAEWEKAARGRDGRRYPWGDEVDPDKANYAETGIGEPSAVGCFANGKSPYGCQDMAGNIWEWAATQGKEASYELQPYPYQVTHQWAEAYLEGTDVRVLRGGAFNDSGVRVRAPVRYHLNPYGWGYSLGFRVVRAPIGSES